MDNPDSSAGSRFCGMCGAPLVPNTSFCASCGNRVELAGAPAASVAATPPGQPPQAPPAQPANAAAFGQQGLRCPRCGSTQVQAAKRGWKWTTGMIGSDKMIATCMQCGNKFDLA